MTFVVDASLTIDLCTSPRGFDATPVPLVAPPLMWSETRANLRLALWRHELSRDAADRAHEALLRAPVQRRDPDGLGAEAWAIADELGWARTYDAEYLALARLLGCRVLTEDRRLRRGADRLGLVILPEEL